MEFTVVFDLLVALEFNDFAIFEFELIGCVFKILLFHQDALKRFGVKPKGRATLKPLLVRVQVDVLEVLIRVLGWHIRCFRNAGVDPLLRSSLNIHMLNRGDVVGRNKVVRQLVVRIIGVRRRIRIHHRVIGQ